MATRTRGLVTLGVISLLVWQSTAQAFPLTTRARWICGATVVAALATTTAVGVVGLNWNNHGPVEVGEYEPTVVPVEVERSELDVRLDNFAALFGQDGRTYFTLAKEDGEMPTLHLFHDSIKRRMIAEGVKAEIRKKKPEAYLPEGPGITVRIEKIGFLAEPGDHDHVRVLVSGGFFQLRSEKLFTRAEIVSGTAFPVRFIPHVQPTKSGGKGTMEAYFVLQYSPERDRFEIRDGEGSFHVQTPGVFGVDDKDKDTLPPSFTARLRIAARP